ncbi:hypothetical protein [Acidocella facilis]|uniref:hypothetical protein n=1 Tax=Acidocella facilis TaxID=525 RepID=UPI001F1C5409|nr:hypothetical protein [Acidocella facilis]
MKNSNPITILEQIRLHGFTQIAEDALALLELSPDWTWYPELLAASLGIRVEAVEPND